MKKRAANQALGPKGIGTEQLADLLSVNEKITSLLGSMLIPKKVKSSTIFSTPFVQEKRIFSWEHRW